MATGDVSINSQVPRACVGRLGVWRFLAFAWHGRWCAFPCKKHGSGRKGHPLPCPLWRNRMVETRSLFGHGCGFLGSVMECLSSSMRLLQVDDRFACTAPPDRPKCDHFMQMWPFWRVFPTKNLRHVRVEHRTTSAIRTRVVPGRTWSERRGCSWFRRISWFRRDPVGFTGGF